MLPRHALQACCTIHDAARSLSEHDYGVACAGGSVDCTLGPLQAQTCEASDSGGTCSTCEFGCKSSDCARSSDCVFSSLHGRARRCEAMLPRHFADSLCRHLLPNVMLHP